jgi:hypothetical protein
MAPYPLQAPYAGTIVQTASMWVVIQRFLWRRGVVF